MKYSNQEFNNISFKQKILIDADFSKSNIDSVDFQSSILRNANFTHVSLNNTNFSNANLAGVNFSNANLADVNFSNANLAGVNFSNANLAGVNFSNTNICGSNFSNAILIDSDFTSSKMGKDFSTGFITIVKGVLFAVFLGISNFGVGSTNTTTLYSKEPNQFIGSSMLMAITSASGIYIFLNSVLIAIRDSNLTRIILSLFVTLLCCGLFFYNLQQCIYSLAKESGTKFYKASLNNIKFNNVFIKDTDFTNAILNQIDWTNTKGDIPSWGTDDIPAK